MHRVSRALGYHPAQDLVPGQGEVADQVQNLVPHELVREAQRAVRDLASGDDDGVLVGDAADQPHVAQLLLVLAKAERPRRRQRPVVGARRQINRKLLAADRRGKVDRVGDGVAVARVHAQELVSFADLNRLEDAQVLAPPALRLEARALDRLDVGQRRAV